MDEVKEAQQGRMFHGVVTAAGLSLWVIAAATIIFLYPPREQLVLVALVALAALVGMFPITFPLPSGLRFSNEKINFTLSDSLIFLVACWYGLIPAVFLAGIEAFIGSRRVVRRLSSNLFSAGMISLAAAAAAASLGAVLRYGFGETGAPGTEAHLSIAVALLAASIVHLVVNVGLLSTLLALRHGDPVVPAWRKNLVGIVPMFIPTSTAAGLIYLALQHGTLIMLVIGGPVLLAIYFGHRQYRDNVSQRVADIEKAHRQTIEAFAVTINAKDEVTHEHVLRVQIYAAGVARLLGCTPLEIEALRAGALLHDVGKIAVPDYILNKPGKLTAAEFDKMKIHTIAGAKILGRVEFPYPVVPVVRSHHERWDGKGYPDGLKGEEIPLTARILSVVDCFDAVREDRQYRKGLTREEAIGLIMEGSGTQYDPQVVGTFITHLPEFEAEIRAHRDAPLPTYGIEPLEALSEAARQVAPAAGLAEAQDAAAQATPDSALNRQEQEALSSLEQAFTTAHSAEELPAVLLVKIAALVPFEACAVTLVAPETGENIVVRAAGLHAVELVGRRIQSGDGVTGWVLAHRQPFCNTDPKLDLSPALAPHFADFRTLACVPIIRGEKLLGALTLYSSSLKEYDARQQYLLQRAASMFAEALSAGKPHASPAATLALAPSAPDFPPLESELTH
jgi:putative nucleotidyltransferase with HDIG domain